MKTMNELYRKNELTFALIWIAAYVVLSMIGDSLSEAVGVMKSVTLAIHLVMCGVLWAWISKNSLKEKYDFRAPEFPAWRFLFFVPLALIALLHIVSGVQGGPTAADTVCCVLSMLCVGFLEEVIFRGLLFRAMAKTDVRSAVIVSSVTFGLGHIVNLAGGKPLGDTLVQILFAVAIGFIMVLIVYRGGSIIPCILFHSANNMLSVLGRPNGLTPQVQLIVNLAEIIVLGVGYVLWLLKALPPKQGA